MFTQKCSELSLQELASAESYFYALRSIAACVSNVYVPSINTTSHNKEWAGPDTPPTQYTANSVGPDSSS